MKLSGLLVKVSGLIVAGALMAGPIVVVFGDFRVQKDTTYRALFTNVSGLTTGQDVRSAGVTVGRVTDLDLRQDKKIMVTFTAQSAIPLTEGTRAVIKYKNLVGDRYLEITEGPGSTRRLPPRGVISISQTAPALDLDELYNGFAPLLQGLQPAQVNQLSGELIEILQGQGGTIDQLLGHIGSLTSTLANRDQVIGQLIDNFNAVLGTVNRHSAQLSSLITQLQRLVSGLAQDRQAIGDSLGHISGLTGKVGNLLRQNRPDIARTVTQADRLFSLLNANRDLLQQDLSRLPEDYRRLSRLGGYGQFFNFYLCGIQIMLSGPKGEPVTTPFVKSQVARCQKHD